MSGAWATDRTWNGGTGGTEDAPLDIYVAGNWNPNGLPTTSDKLNFVTTAPTVVTNNLANGETTQISSDWMLKSGEWTFLGPARFPTLENPGNSGNIDVVKKGDWTLTYAMYLGRSGNTMTFTNYGKMTHTPNNRWFQIGNGGNGPCVLENVSGDWNVGGKFSVGDACKDTKFIWRSGNISATNPTEPFYIGRSIGTDGKVNVEKNEGDWNLQNGLKFNQGKGTFLHNGGTTTVSSGKSTTLAGSSGAVSVLNLNGGTFKTKEIVRGNSGGTATVVFNGGELAANAVSAVGLVATGVSLSAGELGGTINASTLAVSIVPAIGGEGGMTFKGGGSVTLSAAPTYTGVTTVEVGTTLVVPEAIAGDMVFSVPGELADGIYTVVSISGESQFEDDVLSDKAEGFVLSSDKRKICYVKVTGVDTTKPIYIGTDGNLSAAGNWLAGPVPTGGTGDAQIFCASATTLTVGDTFAPAKLIISDGSALVTIGSGTLCVGEIENRQLLAVGTGATVVIGNQLTLAKGESLCDHNYGTLVVSNLLLKAESGDRYLTENQAASASGVFKFGTVTNSMTGNWFYMTDHSAVVPYVFYIGAGGLAFQSATSSAAYCLGRNGDGDSMTTIRPWYSDFTIADRGTGNRSLILQHDITFCTDDESGEGRTITIDANTRGQRSPVITVSGKGTLQVNGTCENSAEPVVTVTDTATLAFGEGASLGTGAITLGAGTTLVLTQPSVSNEFTPLVNTLNLPTGENEVATICIDGKRLKSGVDHEIATVGTGTDANVTLAPASEALDGRKGTLRVEDGKLKLNVQPGGLRVIIR